MSEYPISCNMCGKYLGIVHATKYSNNYLCEDCWNKVKKQQREVKQREKEK